MNYNRDRCGTMLLTVDALHPAAIRKNTLPRWGGWAAESRVGSRQRHRAGQQLITVAETIFMAFTRSVDRWQRWRSAPRGLLGVVQAPHTQTHTLAHTQTGTQIILLRCRAISRRSSSSPFVFFVFFFLCVGQAALATLPSAAPSPSPSLLSILRLAGDRFHWRSIIIWRVPLSASLGPILASNY